MMGKLISFSGAHGTGKTTSATKKKLELKMRHPDASVISLCDLEAFCPIPINKGGTEQAQMWLFGNQIRHEMDALSRFDYVITDRTIVDIAAYTCVLGFHGLAKAMMAYAEQHIPFYSVIYFKNIAHNRFCYPDGIRDAEDKQFRQDVELIMLGFMANLTQADIYPGRIYYV